MASCDLVYVKARPEVQPYIDSICALGDNELHMNTHVLGIQCVIVSAQ